MSLLARKDLRSHGNWQSVKKNKNKNKSELIFFFASLSSVLVSVFMSKFPLLFFLLRMQFYQKCWTWDRKIGFPLKS